MPDLVAPHVGEPPRRAAPELERAIRARDAYIGAMGHDLRTPLHGLLALSEALEDGTYGLLAPQQREAVARFGEIGRQLLAAVGDILHLAGADTGAIEPAFAPVDFADVCSASLRVVAERARRKGVSVAVGLQSDLRFVADGRRVQQLLVHLLTNAVAFTPEGGRIGVEAGIDAARASLRVVVWDTGIGIGAADLERIFEPYVQLGAAPRAGCGVGLTLARRIAEQHGGEVRVESEPGRGARFIVRLPLEQRGAGRVHDGQRAPPTRRSSQGEANQVLVADDDEGNLAVLRDVLRHRGWVVCEARDGRDAVAQARAQRPAVVLMDVEMPHLDGLSAIRAIRADPAVAATPVIAVTALSTPADEARCRAAGADAYMAKPIAVGRLVALMEQLAGAR